MPYISLREAAALAGVPLRTFQRWVAQGRIPAHHSGKRALVVLDSDVAYLVAQMPTRSPGELATLVARIDALEARMSAMESQSSKPLPNPITRPPALPTRQDTPLTPNTTLPDGLVSWRSFAQRHGIAASTVAKAIATGRLVVIEGEWKSGRTTIKGALDAAGQRQFVELWAGRPGWIACAECPHGVTRR